MTDHRFFWRQHPALLFALTLLIGDGSALFWHGPSQWIFPLLWCGYLIWLRKWPILPLMAAMITYCHFLHDKTPAPGETQGIFSIATLQRHQSPL